MPRWPFKALSCKITSGVMRRYRFEQSTVTRSKNGRNGQKLTIMNSWQQTLIFLYAAFNFLVFFRGYYESKYKKNAYGLTRPLSFIGAFVWGDAVVFGIFWVLSSLVALALKDWYLFLLIISVFWVVRSLGETIYWFNQQFSTINRNPIRNLPWNSIFHNDSVWFIHQIIWQCVAVVSVIFSIYFANLWLNSFGS